MEKGPAEKFAQALKRGDLANAAKELKDLKDKLDAGKLNPEDQRKLAKQLQQIQQNLENLVNAHQQAMQNLEKKINELRQQGKNDEANKLQQELAKLQNQLPQMNNLQQMAGKLAQCAQKMQNGQLKDVHHLAFGIRDLVIALADKAKAATPANESKLNGMVEQVKASASKLDELGDAGNLSGTQTEYAKLEVVLGAIKTVTGAN